MAALEAPLGEELSEGASLRVVVHAGGGHDRENQK